MVLPIIAAAIAAAFQITVIILVIYANRPIEQGCGEWVNDEPTLGVTTKDVSNGKTDAQVYGRILTKDDEDNYDWSDWRRLNHAWCDDREKGKTDFYDDFAEITDEWEAIALYNCGTDGWALDSVTYWNGTNSNHEILMFCDNIAGPSVSCYQDEVEDAEASCYPGFDDRLFDYVWIDQNNAGCPGITLNLQNRNGRDLYVGKVFAQSNPGIPDCSVNNALSITSNIITDDDGSPSSLYIIFALLIVLLLINILCYGYKNCANHKSKRDKYSKVNQQSISSEDEAQHLNNV